MNRLSFLTGFALVACAGGIAHAQACDGHTPFSVAPMRAAGDLTVLDRAEVYNASFAIGQSSPGLFGGATMAGARSDEFGTKRSYGLFTGYSVPVKALGATEICPVVDLHSGWSALNGMSDDPVLSLGAAVGHTIVASPTLDVVPFGDLRYHSANRGTLALGAGMIFSKTLTVRPSIMLPLANESMTGAFGLTFGYNFGAR